MSMKAVRRLPRQLTKDFRMIRSGKRTEDRLKAVYWALWKHYDLFRTYYPKLAQVLPPLNLIRRTVLNLDDGEFVVPDMASIGLFTEEYEHWIWDYLDVQQGDSFLDIGAHVGRYTVKLARLVGEHGYVIAVEPHPENYELLSQNIQHSGLQNIAAFNVAAWGGGLESPTALELFPGKDAGTHSLKRSLQTWHGFQRKGRGPKVEVVEMDALLETVGRRIDWVKIDVEGAEIEVLQGLKRTLTVDQPNLIVESWGPNQRRLFRLMEDFRYSVTPTPSPSNFFCSHSQLDPGLPAELGGGPG